MSTLYDSHIAHELALALSISDAFARKVLLAIKDRLAAGLLAGDELTLTGFGRFYCKRVSAKTLRNPRGGVGIVEAHRCPAWKPSETLKDKIRRIGPMGPIGRSGARCAPGGARERSRVKK